MYVGLFYYKMSENKKSCTIHDTAFFIVLIYYPKNPNKIPAATAEPITPATFGPIACISK